MDEKYEYDVAFSFAGEDREIVEQLYELLKARGIRVFYDRAHEADLWGKNLVEHLGEIYSRKAHYCILFVSRHSVDKPWTRWERQHAQERALHDKSEYLLPIRLDDSVVPGLSEVVGHLDVHSRTTQEIADIIIQKLGKEPERDSPIVEVSGPNIPLPRIKRQFTDLDRESFAQDLFASIRTYFESALKRLDDADHEVKAELQILSDTKFVASIYLRGNLRQQIKIWRGGWIPDSRSDQVCYSLGTHVDLEQDNSMSGWILVEDDGFELRAKLDNFSVADFAQPREISEKEAIAEAIWLRFSSALER